MFFLLLVLVSISLIVALRSTKDPNLEGTTTVRSLKGKKGKKAKGGFTEESFDNYDDRLDRREDRLDRRQDRFDNIFGDDCSNSFRRNCFDICTRRDRSSSLDNYCDFCSDVCNGDTTSFDPSFSRCVEDCADRFAFEGDGCNGDRVRNLDYLERCVRRC